MTSLLPTVQSANGAMDDEKLKRFGWAPGRYLITCKKCGDRAHDVDKRAVSCKPCARAAAYKAMANEPSEIVEIDYTNWQGERGKRRIVPHRIEFGSNEWHPEPQWLLVAYDHDKNAMRFFAMASIHSWTPIERKSLEPGGER